MPEHPGENVILIVDDCPGFRAFHRIALEHAGGFRVIEAGGGRQALDNCCTEPISLILLDTMMPDMHGFEVIRALRSDPATVAIPVIFASPQSDANTITTALESGAADYLVMPFAPQRLVETVRRVLSGK